MAQLIGIGVGPGDPDLLTVKAVKAIQDADVIMCPASAEDRPSIALSVISSLIDKSKNQEIVKLIFPMTKDKDILEAHWKTNAKIMAEKVLSGKNVVYLTVGDPYLYSTWIYMHRDISANYPDIKISVIPGIVSMFTFASKVGISIAEGAEKVAIIPSCYDLNSVKEIAKKHDMLVTFMPKPTIGDWRSGGHINFSLQDVNTNTNLFKDGDKWSEESLHAVGGLLAHSEALTAITCPTVNSYNGLVPTVGGFEGGVHTWAPTNITYGHNNRSAQFRLPQNRYCIENRAADLTMNVYLALGMTISAAVEGIINKTDPGKPSDFDLYTLNDEDFKKLGIRRLPRNLLQAVDYLEKDKLAEKVLGKVMLNSYVNYKKDEWERYHQAVTDWEVKEYLRLY